MSIIFVGILFSCDYDNSQPQSPSANLERLPIFDLKIDQEDYLSLLNNRLINMRVPCKILYESREYTGSIRAAGAGSRYWAKWSYNVQLDNNDEIEGLNSFNLSAQVSDPTMIYTNIALSCYSGIGLPTLNAFHVFVRINGNDQGLYTVIEKIKIPFFDVRNMEYYELFKVMADSRFTFKFENHPEFTFKKEIPEDDNFTNLLRLINAIDTSSSDNLEMTLGKYIDIENYLDYHIMTTLIFNNDAFQNNFYLFKESSSKPFTVIPWDFDSSFEYNENTELIYRNHLVSKILKNKKYQDMFIDKLKYQSEHIYTEDRLFHIIDSTADVIREAYRIDDYLGGRYDLDDKIVGLKAFIKNVRQHVRDSADYIKF